VWATDVPHAAPRLRLMEIAPDDSLRRLVCRGRKDEGNHSRGTEGVPGPSMHRNPRRRPTPIAFRGAYAIAGVGNYASINTHRWGFM
jgi:hypothetical protein